MSWLERSGRVLDGVFAPLLLLLLVGPALVVEVWTDRTFIVSHSTFILAVGWAVIVLGAAARALQGRAVLGSGTNGGRVFVLVAAGWLALTSLLAYQPAIAWFGTLCVLSHLLLGQTVRDWLEGRPCRRWWLIAGITAIVGVQTVVGAIQFFKVPLQGLVEAVPILSAADGRILPGGSWLYDLVFALNYIGGQGAVVGTLGNYNYLAEFLALSLPILAGAAFCLRTGWPRWVALSALATSFLVLFSTGGRGALLGLLVGGVASAFWVFGKGWIDPRGWWASKQTRLLAVAGMALLVCAIGVAGGRFQTKLNAVMSGADPSIISRLVHWQVAASMVGDRPIFGTGMGGYRLLNVEKLEAVFPEGPPQAVAGLRFHQAHNDPLQAAVELGLPGVLLLFGGFIVWGRQVRRSDVLPQPLRFGLLWGVSALLVASAFGFPFQIPLTALALTLVLAMGATPTPSSSSAPLNPVFRPMYALVAVLVFGAAGTLFLQKQVWPNYMAHRYLEVGQQVEKKARQSPATPAIFMLADRHLAYKGEVTVTRMKLLLEQKEYEAALRVYAAGDKLGLGHDALYWKARALGELGRTKEAERAFTRVVKFYPDTDPYHVLSKRMLKRLQKPGTPSS